MGNIGEYQVWRWRGRGVEPGPCFATLSKAVDYIREHAEEAAHGIFLPDGQWHCWPGSNQVMLMPREAPHQLRACEGIE